MHRRESPLDDMLRQQSTLVFCADPSWPQASTGQCLSIRWSQPCLPCPAGAGTCGTPTNSSSGRGPEWYCLRVAVVAVNGVITSWYRGRRSCPGLPGDRSDSSWPGGQQNIPPRRTVFIEQSFGSSCWPEQNCHHHVKGQVSHPVPMFSVLCKSACPPAIFPALIRNKFLTWGVHNSPMILHATFISSSPCRNFHGRAVIVGLLTVLFPRSSTLLCRILAIGRRGTSRNGAGPVSVPNEIAPASKGTRFI